MDKDKQLIEKKESFFDKIINFFKGFFKLNNKKVQEENNLQNISNKETNNKENSNKEKYVDLYNKIKNNEIDINEISFTDAFILNAMYDKEIEIMQNEIEKTINKNKVIHKNLKDIKKKNLIV